MRKNYLENRWNHASMNMKLMISFTLTIVIMLALNIYMYMNLNSFMAKVDEVYASNVDLNDLLDSLNEEQNSVKEYLDTKSSDSLDAYYRADQNYRKQLENLNTKIMNNKMMITEKNIYEQSNNYLNVVYETVQAKRGRNVEKYKTYYEQAEAMCRDIQNCIFSLNNEQFRNNSNSYTVLLSSIRYLEIISTFILFLIGGINLILIFLLTRSMTMPLNMLSKAANEVADGNFDIVIEEVQTQDEIGVVSRAFQKMIASIHVYISELKNSMERESQLKEKELIMESRMKETQLRTLQAQINPHFLFNTLNAGAQLSMMEGADKSTEFLENVAEFFRYNIKKMNQNTTIREEVKLVDHYIYILNVRFTGEIHYEKEIDESLLDVMMPSMILQPIVENAVNYGIRNIDWEGKIILRIYRKDDMVCLSVWDNGSGMEQEKIDQILSGEMKEVDLASNSNGIGLGNVMERLRIFTGIEDVMEIESGGLDQGSEFILKIPMYL